MTREEIVIGQSEIIAHSNFQADPESKMNFEWVGPEDGEVAVARELVYLLEQLPWEMEQVREEADGRTLYFKRVAA